MKHDLPETANRFSLSESEKTNASGLWRPPTRSGSVPVSRRDDDLPSVYHTRQKRERLSGPQSRSFPATAGLLNGGGRAMSGGWDKLLQDITTSVEGTLEDWKESPRGGTPIERLFLQSLVWYTKLEGMDFGSVLNCSPEEWRESPGFDPISMPLFVRSEVQLPFGRVDFLIAAEGLEPRRFRQLIVECDGHAFHERTKEQAAKDRNRDREAVLAGYDVFRFTGSELWRDPWGCAAKVHEWAARGVWTAGGVA